MENQENKQLDKIVNINIFYLIVIIFIIIAFKIFFWSSVENGKKPLKQFDLVKAESKCHFTNGMLQDSFVNIKLYDNMLVIEKDTIKNLKYQYWYYGKPHILSWENNRVIVQYKSIDFSTPHSIDIFHKKEDELIHEQWLF